MARQMGQVMGNRRLQRVVPGAHRTHSGTSAMPQAQAESPQGEGREEPESAQAESSPVKRAADKGDDFKAAGTGGNLQATTGEMSRTRSEIQAEVSPFETTGERKVSNRVESEIRSLQQGGEALPTAVQTDMESRLGEDFSGVRIHRDEKAAATADQLDARAFTVGNHIAFNAGEFAPETGAGKQLLAHELTHVAQQKGAAEPQTVARETQSGNQSQGNLLEQLQKKIAEIISRAQEMAGQKAGEIESHASGEGAAVEGQGRTGGQSVTADAAVKGAATEARSAADGARVEAQAAGDAAKEQQQSQAQATAVAARAGAEAQQETGVVQSQSQTIGAQSAAQQGLLESQTQAHSATLQGQWGSLTGRSHSSVQSVQTQAQAAWGGVENQAQTMGAGLQTTWGGTEAQVQGQLPAVQSNAAASLRSLRDEAISMVESAKPGSGAALGSLEGQKSGLVARAQALLTEGGGPIAQLLAMLQSGWDGLKGAAATGWGAARQGASGIWDLLKGLGGSAWEGLQNGWQQLQSLGQGLWQGLAAQAKNAWTGLKTLATNAWTGLKTMASNAWTGLKTMATNAWTGLKTMATGAWTGLKTMGTNAWTGLKTMGTNAWTGLKTMGNGLWSALKGKGGSAESSTEGKKNSALSALQSLASGFMDKIGSIFGGLRQRASGALSQLKGRVQGAVGGLQQTNAQALAGLQARNSAAQAQLQQRNQSALTGLDGAGKQALGSLQARNAAAQTGLQGQSQSLLQQLMGIGSRAVTGLQGFGQQLLGRLTGVWNGIKGSAGGVWQAFKNGLSAISQRLKGLWDALRERLGAVWQRIQKAFEALKARIMQLWNQFKRGWLGILGRALGLWGRARGTDAAGWPGVTKEAGALKADALRLKARAGGPGAEQDPAAVRDQLGEGRPLEGSVRSGMEGAFGAGLDKVRIHTDDKAAQLAQKSNARAFAVGEHIAFNAGEYKPGTMVGDALLAHEVAHTVQQQGANPETAAKGYAAEESGEEMEADRAAIGAVASRWLGAKGMISRLPMEMLPRLRSGLGLRKCSGTSPNIQVQIADVGASGVIEPEVATPVNVTITRPTPTATSTPATTPSPSTTPQPTNSGGATATPQNLGIDLRVEGSGGENGNATVNPASLMDTGAVQVTGTELSISRNKNLRLSAYVGSTKLASSAPFGVMFATLEQTLGYLLDKNLIDPIGRAVDLAPTTERRTVAGNSALMGRLKTALSPEGYAELRKRLGDEVPTGNDLLNKAEVQNALASAWTDSNVMDANNRHEEGGWIIWNWADESITINRVPAGTRAGLGTIVGTRPANDNVKQVSAWFHTHPNPAGNDPTTGNTYGLGPSSGDTGFANGEGVPGMVREYATNTTPAGGATHDLAFGPTRASVDPAATGNNPIRQKIVDENGRERDEI